MMNKKLALALAGLALVSTAAGAKAIAGYKTAGAVVVNLAGRSAQGSMGYARATPDGLTYVGCQVQVVNGSAPGMNCYIRSSTGQVGYCSSGDPDMMSLMSAINSDSFIAFEWDENQVCTTLYVATHSAYQPKAM